MRNRTTDRRASDEPRARASSASSARGPKEAAAAVLGETPNAARTAPSARDIAANAPAARQPQGAPEGGGGGAAAGPKEGGYRTRASSVVMTGFESIIDNLFTFDADATFANVIKGLELSQPASQTDYGTLVDALNAAEEIARQALQLVANAKVANARYTADVGVIRAELHEQCVAELMEQYRKEVEAEAGEKRKTSTARKPTIGDIDAYKAANYNDEWSDIEERLAKSKETVHYLEGLAGLAAQRARDLRQMVASSRGA